MSQFESLTLSQLQSNTNECSKQKVSLTEKKLEKSLKLDTFTTHIQFEITPVAS